MSSAMETSLSSSSSSSSTSVASSVDDNDDNNNDDNDNDNGILDDLLVPGDYAAAINGSKIQSSSSSVAMLSGECYCYTEGIRTQRQRQRDREEDRHKLFDKRWYRSPQMLPASVASSMASDDKTKHRTPKTEPETAVLADCIHNHFLLACNRHHHRHRRRQQQQQHLHHNHGLGNDGGDDSSSSNIMVEAILSRFEKVTCRTNEIIFREGDVAEYLYVLYRGEVLVRVRRSSEPEPETEPHTNGNGNGNENENENGNQNHDDGGEEEEDNDDQETKYKILGELELLTNSSSYRSTTKATSDPCVLFRLAARDFREYFIPHRGKARLDIPNDEDKYEDKYEYDERALEILKRAMPPELSAYFFPQNGDNDYHRKLWLQLWSERTIRNFRAGDVLVHKSKPVRGLVIVTEGLVRATNNTAGGRSYEDLAVGPDQSRTAFGWQSVLVLVPPSDKDVVVDDDDDATEPLDRSSSSSSSSSIPMMGTVRAETDGQAIVISKKSFETVFCHSCYHHEHHHYHHRPPLLDVAALRRRQWKRTQLQQITVFRDSGLDATQIDGLLDGMHHCEYGREEPILKAGQKVDAAMYFVRRGTVRLERNKGRDVQLIEKGGYFGETNMLLDQNMSDNDRHYRKRSVVSAISVTDSTKLDVLYLEECRTVVNTRILGLGKNTNATVTAIDESVRWADLKRHKLIGTGGFGQVWLVSTSTSNSNSNSSSRTTDAVTTTALGESGDAAATNGTNGTTKRRRFFALKVQAKFSILQSNDATSLIAERNIMASLRSPFLLRLFNAFQDDHRLYMVTSLLQGGELESIVPETGFPERVARFYAAGVLEALTHLHRRHILHRDVKPENILLNGKGYPVLIDFGFAKYVPEKTYTFCGSPMFMAPETILYQGQTKGVDHWAWAVLVYRLVTGNYPFYNSKGMSEMALYKRICRGTFEVTGAMSADFRMLLISVLVPDPSQRLGSRANGWRDLFDAPWLAKAFSPSDRIQLRKQALPAPWIRVSPGDGSANEHDGDCDNDDDDDDDAPGSFVHQSSSEVEDLLDNDICGKIADDQQHIFASFGPRVDSPIGNI